MEVKKVEVLDYPLGFYEEILEEVLFVEEQETEAYKEIREIIEKDGRVLKALC